MMLYPPPSRPWIRLVVANSRSAQPTAARMTGERFGFMTNAFRSGMASGAR